MADNGDNGKNTNEQEKGGSQEEKRFEGEFDAERAARLIENLRSEVSSLKEERNELKSEKQEREDAEKTEVERLKDALERAQGETKTAKRDAALRRAQAKHGLSDEDVEEFLDGVDEDKIEARAARLAERLGTGSGGSQEERGGDGEENGEENGEEDSDDGLSSKPKPGLTPGTGGGSDDDVDEDALYEAARSRRGY